MRKIGKQKEVVLLDTSMMEMEAYDEGSDFSQSMAEGMDEMPSVEERLDSMFYGLNVAGYLSKLIDTIVSYAEARTHKTGIAWVVLEGSRSGWGGGAGALYFRPGEEIHLNYDHIKILINEDANLEIITSDHDGSTYTTLTLFTKKEEAVSTYRNGFYNRIDDEGSYYDAETAKHYMRGELEKKAHYRLSRQLQASLLEISEYE